MILFGFGKGRREQTQEKIDFRTVSETGLVRGENQDRVFVDRERLVFCVADGVGGGQDGALASEMVCSNLKMMLYAAADDFSSRLAAVQQAVEEANEEIHERTLRKGLGTMGSTVAVVVIDPDDRHRLAVCNVGDSRVYLIRGGMPERLTVDHRGAVPGSLTRAVGCSGRIEVEWSEIKAGDGSRILICTDGVHDVIGDPRIAVFASGGSLSAAAERLSSDVFKHGAPDNFSFVLVSI